MTIKEIAKLLCILAGYDNDIRYESHATDDIANNYYSILAFDDEENHINADSFGTIDFISDILESITGKYTTPVWMKQIPLKCLLDDDYRNTFKKLEKLKEDFYESIKPFEHEFQKWLDANNPCPNCTINKKDHRDDIHYNCEEHHTMRCPVLRKYMDDYPIKRQEIINDNPEYQKIVEEFNSKRDEFNSKLTEIYNKIYKK